MPRVCTICTHPQRAAIEQALAAGDAFRMIAKRFGISPTALFRHKQAHLSMRSTPAPIAVSRDAPSVETLPRRNHPLRQRLTRRTIPATAASLPNGGNLFPEISDHKKRAFLAAFAQFGQREAAATALGIDSRTHRYWMQKDPVYVEAFKRAEAFVADRIEDEIFRRGVEGVERGVWWNGVQVGTERHYSDTLLIFAAKGALPDKYRERGEVQHDVSDTLRQIWEGLRDHPAAPDRPAYDAEGEVAEPGSLPGGDGLPPRPPLPLNPDFSILDRANFADEPDYDASDEDEA